MKNGSTCAMLFWVLLMQAGAASAAELTPAAFKPVAPSAAAVGVNPLRLMLESKLRLVKLLLAQSPAVQRIPQSDNAEAKKKLADAQAHYAKAETESNAGRVETAIQLLDESLRQIVSASYLAPDVTQQAAQERRRNTDLREAIRTFQTLHKNISSHMSARKVQNSAGAADIGQIDGMVDKADIHIAGGNPHEANVLLNDAYKIVVSALNKTLTAETIVYDLKFDSPAEEFRHELARNRSYEELIPIALAQSNTTRETTILAQRSVQQSRDLRDAAQKQARGGDHQAAVKSLQDATSHLQRSLRIAGVVVPQTPQIIMP
jgi:tetratricopeptide (TPR) repeat protein